MPQRYDINGNPIAEAKPQYDINGNPIGVQPTGSTPRISAAEWAHELDKSLAGPALLPPIEFAPENKIRHVGDFIQTTPDPSQPFRYEGGEPAPPPNALFTGVKHKGVVDPQTGKITETPDLSDPEYWKRWGQAYGMETLAPLAGSIAGGVAGGTALAETGPVAAFGVIGGSRLGGMAGAAVGSAYSDIYRRQFDSDYTRSIPEALASGAANVGINVFVPKALTPWGKLPANVDKDLFKLMMTGRNYAKGAAIRGAQGAGISVGNTLAQAGISRMPGGEEPIPVTPDLLKNSALIGAGMGAALSVPETIMLNRVGAKLASQHIPEPEPVPVDIPQQTTSTKFELPTQAETDALKGAGALPKVVWPEASPGVEQAAATGYYGSPEFSLRVPDTTPVPAPKVAGRDFFTPSMLAKISPPEVPLTAAEKAARMKDLGNIMRQTTEPVPVVAPMSAKASPETKDLAYFLRLARGLAPETPAPVVPKPSGPPGQIKLPFDQTLETAKTRTVFPRSATGAKTVFPEGPLTKAELKLGATPPPEPPPDWWTIPPTEKPKRLPFKAKVKKPTTNIQEETPKPSVPKSEPASSSKGPTKGSLGAFPGNLGPLMKANPKLTGALTGGAIGAYTGSETGSTPEEQQRNMILGGLGGAIAGSYGSRLLSATKQEPSVVKNLDRLSALRQAAEETAMSRIKPKGLTRAQEAITNWHAQITKDTKGLKLPAKADPDQALDRLTGGAMGKVEDARIRLDSMMTDVKAKGLETHLRNYLDLTGFQHGFDTIDRTIQSHIRKGELKKAQELLDKIAKGEAMPVGYTPGKTQADLARLRNALGPAKFAEVQKASKAIFDLNFEGLEMLKDSGIVGQATFNALKKRSGDYIPLTRYIDHTITADFSPSKPLSVASDPDWEHILGSQRPTLDPIMSSFRRYQRIVKLTARNDAASSITDLATHPVAKALVRELKPGDAAKAGEGVIRRMIDGKSKEFAVPALWAKEMQNVDTDAMTFSGSVFAKVLGATRNLMQTLATTGNLPFATANPIKDIQDANLFLKMPFNPKRLAVFAAEWAKAAKDIFNETPAYREFLRSGASYSGLQKSINPKSFANFGDTRDLSIVDRLLRPVEILSNTTEEATKMATWRTSLKEGMDPFEAITLARRYGGSPDFGRRGTMSKDLNLLMMFANAQIQGITRLKKLVTDPKVAMTALGVITPLAYMQAKWNSQFTDADGRPSWDRVSTNDKNNYFVILRDEMENINGIQRHRYYKIPLGHAVKLIYAPMRDVFDGEISKDPKQTALNFASNLLPGNINIAKAKPLESIGAGVLSSLNPAIKWPLEYWKNYNSYSQNKIVPAALEKAPANEQWTSETSPSILAATQWMNKGTEKVLGAGPVTEALETSPMILEHGLKTFTGGPGEMLLSGVDSLLRKPPIEPLTGDRAVTRTPVFGPLLRRFVGSGVDQVQRDLTERAYNAYNNATSVNAALAIKKSRRPDELMEFMQQPANVSALVIYRKLNPMMQELGKLRSQRQFIEGSRPPNAAQLMQSIAQRERIYVTQANMLLDSLGYPK